MVKQKYRRSVLGVFLAALMVFGALFGSMAWTVQATDKNISADRVVNFQPLGDQSDKFIYLSDIDYLPSSRSGYGPLLKDAAARISLQYEGQTVAFEKGLWAHATSNLDYDLQNYQEYDYLAMYYGVNNTSNGNGSVKFYIYTSDDGRDWNLVSDADPVVMKIGMTAGYVELPIKGVNYLRLVADANGSNANDHAVYGDAKLVKSGYKRYSVPASEEYDEEIKTDFADAEIDKNADFEIEVLRRNLVANAGQYALTTFIEESAENVETLNWLFNDLEMLRMYTTGGRPSGSYLGSLRALNKLYHAYKDDLSDRTPLKTVGLVGTRGDLYKRMMISISLTHASEVRFWVRDTGEMAGNASSPNISDPVKRYAVYKRMYLAGKLVDSIFESIEVEEMRYVMATELGDDEIEWLNDYLTAKNRPNYSWPPVPYISIGNHYWYDSNYAPENQPKWNEKYLLVGANYRGDNDYTVSGNYKIGFEKYAPHLWMVMEHGGVCWQISNTGQNMVASRGIPSTTFGQPGHVAYANYEVKNGTPVWALTNDVSGWPQTNFTGYTNTHTYHQVRQLNNWGSTDGSYLNINRYGFQGSYVVMSQAALNDFDNYEKSQELVALAKVYAGDLAKQEEIYREALNTQNINFDAWTGLIRTYMADDKRTAAEYYALAKEVTSALKLFPVPTYDLLQAIISKVPVETEPAYYSALQMLLTNTLKEMTTTPDSEFAQAGVTRTMANYLLGRLNNEVATFSFDGDENTAGYLKLGAKYENSSAAWEYSLDGGNTWSSGENSDKWMTEKAIKLSDEQLASLTAENDIKVHIQGVTRAPENIYTIDITNQDVPAIWYPNDKENRVVGVSEKAQWRWGEDGEWVSYAAASPDLTGDKTIQLRNGATGTKLASESREYSFTADTLNPKRHYVPVSHLSVAGVSSEATGNQGNASYAIDANGNTRWHSNWSGADQDKWITIEFDYQVYLSALEYLPAGGKNGRILQGEISASMDGENWEVIATTDWDNNDDWKTYDFTEPVQLKYLRIKGIRTSSASSLSFITARMFNFYEDMTLDPRPTAGIAYSTTEPTSGEVMARLVNASEPIMITNNGGSDTYVFRDNGSFTFEFEDQSGQKGTVTAKVDWILHDAPVGWIEYGCARGEGGEMDENLDCSGSKKVNRSVTARLVFPEGTEVTVLNNGGAEIVANSRNGQDDEVSQDSKDPFTYLFIENGSFVFEYVDKAGNKGSVVAKVDWIDKIAPEAVIEYSTTAETDEAVVARLVKRYPEDEDFSVINNAGSMERRFDENGEFEFLYRDEAGNRATAVARVDWIKKKPTDENQGGGDESGANNGGVVGGSDEGTSGGVNSGMNGGVANGGANVAVNDSSEVVVVGSLPDGAKVESRRLVLPDELRNKFGKNSEYYDFRFVDAEGNALSQEEAKKMTIEIPKGKKLKKVYLVKEDGTTEEVEFEKVDDNHIRLKNPTSGKYLFEYEDEAAGTGSAVENDKDGDKTAEEDKANAKEWYQNPWIWGGVGLGMLLLIILGVGMTGNRRR